MPAQLIANVENNFTKGFVTEYTGLNFPENAATSADNCTFTLVSDVIRRQGIDRETNFLSNTIDRTGKALNTYKWNNVAGQGEQQFLVTQVGSTLYFWDVDASTILLPLSNNKSSATVDVSAFTAVGGTFDATKECQFSDGNGYLFVYHPSCDPFYCTYNAGTITGTLITVQVRDFQGVADGLPVNTRTTTATGLTDAHLYNLSNQGWTQGAAWSAQSTTGQTFSTGVKTFTVPAAIAGVTVGDQVVVNMINNLGTPIAPGTYIMSGNVTVYAGTSMTVNVTSTNYFGTPGGPTWSIVPTNHGYITTWNTAVGSYPSNADVWWTFKNTTNVFDPATQINNTTLNTGFAPKGHFLLSAFSQQRDSASAIATIDDVITMARPRTGTWFQGRVWYTGVDGANAATGVANAYTWTENIYFSQIVLDTTHFGQCYQANDPTSETLFDLLPTDGGVIVIQGSGAIYKLFPFQNGLLVFASNGIWFITGSQGIGFAANDYTITKISAIKSFSSSSFVDVQGLPYFWNEDGIYAVQPTQGGGLAVNSITFTTIDTYYSEIPLSSKKLARGDYDPINYVIKWIFKDTEATDVTDRYAFNKILNFNTANKAFYPYTVSISPTSINSVTYISGPGGSTCPPPAFKHIATNGTSLSFADEHDTNYVDWHSVTDVTYESSFITGYKVHGQAQRRFQAPYVYVFSRTDGGSVSYKIQSIWDYARAGNSGRWSAEQRFTLNDPNFDVIFRRVKLRGHGLALQLKFNSVSGAPFDFIGWSVLESVNSGI